MRLVAFDERLADRVRTLLSARADVVEKRMFGGLAFLARGNMCCAVHGSALIVRLDPRETERALTAPHTRIFDLTGRRMKGWIMVESGGLTSASSLGKWVRNTLRFADSLPAK
ncbi:MAG: TfoX/Sxy family protein [Gemmatimonadaceae bacterium]